MDFSEDQFRQLVTEHQNRVITMCHRFLNDRADAEDTAQEVFLEVYRSRKRFRGDSLLSTWIYRICVTKCLDVIRSRNRKKRFGFVTSLFGGENTAESTPVAETTDPLMDLERSERFRVLYQALDSLAENQRIAITLSKIEGFSSQEIADIMGTTTSAVDSLIHRGRTNLKAKLKRYYEEF